MPRALSALASVLLVVVAGLWSAPGQNKVTRNNLLAYSLTTGALLAGWAPDPSSIRPTAG